MEQAERDNWAEARKQGRSQFILGGKWYISAAFISLLIFVVMLVITRNNIIKDFSDGLAYFFAFFIIRTAHRSYLWYSNEKKYNT